MERYPEIISTADGVSLALYSWGFGRPRQLMIHGLGDAALVWRSCVASATNAESGLAFDLRGHGESSWDPLRRYASAVHAADAVLVLESLDLRGVTLVGHSLGADVAIRTAVAVGSRVRALVLVDGGPEVRPQAGEIVLGQLRDQRWRYDSVPQYTSLLCERLPLAKESALADFAASTLRECEPGGYELKCDPALVHGVLPPEADTLRGYLSSLTCPVLVVRGARSSVLSADGAVRTAGYVRNGRVVTVARAGHAVMLDNPSGFREALGDM